MEFISKILETLEVDTWEDLPDTYLRVEATSSKVTKIGHILKDQWFDPQEISPYMEKGQDK